MGKSALSSVDWWHAHRAAGDRRRRFARVGPGRAAAALRCARGRLPRQLRRRRPTARRRRDVAGLIAFAPDGPPGGPRGPGAPRASRCSRCTATETRRPAPRSFGCAARPASTRGCATSSSPAGWAAPPLDPDGDEVLAVADSGPAWTASAGPGARAPRALRAGRARAPTSPSTRCSPRARWPRSPSSTSCAPSRRPPAGVRRRCGRRCTSTTRTCAGAATASSTTASCSSTPTRTATTWPWRRSRSTPGAPTARPPRSSASAPIASRWSSTATTTSRASSWRPRTSPTPPRWRRRRCAASSASSAAPALRVDRVMTPPHGMCSEHMTRALGAAGLRCAGGHLPAAVDRSLPVGPAAGRLAPGGLGRRAAPSSRASR